ncbi:MAG: CinA family nicotinamide mononucleotide deamidase-related protein [SAR324 cluster bacterium]|nr:CinA family nicotinamide mononucleotide deamidase-related protein [SAR324 cluster bacterium]
MPRFSNKIKLGLLLTGNEVVSGDILDSNSIFIAKEFHAVGLNTTIKTAIGDHLETIAATLKSMSLGLDILIVNGGLGSTVDDMSAEAAALATGNKLIEHPEAIAHIEKKTMIRQGLARSLQFKQALIPEGASLIHNAKGTALGFCLTINDCRCYFTPGVPQELMVMIKEEIIEDVLKAFDLRRPLEILRFNVLGLGESRIQQMIHDNIPKETTDKLLLGFRADNANTEVKLSLFDVTDQKLLEDTAKKVKALFPDYVFSSGPSLACTINQILRERKSRLSLAESCTGGLIGSLITGVAGSSDVFEAGFITYSYASKTKVLGVDADLLADRGAVCDEVVETMAAGAIKQTGCEFALAVSGIAGPSGGTPDKPVGTVHIAWGSQGDIHTRKLWIQRERTQFQQYTAYAALDLLRRYLEGHPTNIPYYFDGLTKHLLPAG